MIFKYKYEIVGGFVHVNFFAGKHADALGKVGELHFREEEYHAFQHIQRIGESYQDKLDKDAVEIVFVKDNPDV